MTGETRDDLTGALIRGLQGALDSSLEAMNNAIALHRDDGPLAAIAFIADYLSMVDAVDPEIEATLSDDWLTRWAVLDSKAAQ